jgi:cytochrome P450
MTDALVEHPDYDSFCQQTLQDPYPLFEQMRLHEPMHWSSTMHMWLVTRYEDVFAGQNDRKRLISSRRRMYIDPLKPEHRAAAMPIIEHVSLWMQNVNPPDHTRMRKLVGLAFTPRMLTNLKPRIEQLVDDLLDKLSGQREVDLIDTFCMPLPAIVICEMLGIPDEDRDRFRHSVEGLIGFSGAAGPGLNDRVARARESLDDVIAMFDELVESRRRNPADDLISAMAAAEADGDRLSRDELFAMCVFIYVAGHETTVSLLSNGVLALLQNPDQMAIFKADPDGLAESAVEEFTRYESPVTRSVRVPIHDFEWAGQTVREGQTITMLIGAANRDPSVFDDPDRLDIKRTPNKHLGFGHGIHFCLGAPLARLEAQIAFPAIIKRLPNMQLAGETRYRPAFGIRSLEALPLRL